MKIKLQFSSEATFGSKAIEWLEWSDMSHVDFVLPFGRLLGARMSGGVQIRPPHYNKFTRTAIYSVDASEHVIKLAKSQIGKPYDKAAILAFIWHHRAWSDERAWFCSELVAWAFEQAGVPLLDSDKLYRITPGELMLSPLLHRIA